MLMKSIMTSLVLTAAPLWLTGVWPGAGGRDVVVRSGQPSPCCQLPTCCKTAKDSNAVVRTADVVKTAGDAPRAVAVYKGTRSATSAPGVTGHMVVFAGDDEDSGAWLGVQIGEVPEALSAQLDLDDRGIMITNVVEDSPAEHAGLKPHDIVVSIDGETVSANAAELAGAIGKHEPNTDVTLSILRNGKPKTIEVTLGARPGQYAWRFHNQSGDDEEIEDSFSTTGRIILQGPGGQWVVKDLKEIEGLGDDIKAMIPDVGTMSTFIHKGDGDKSFEIRISHDGQDIKVSRKDDGDITVTRKDEDGEETTTVYDSEDALRDADEEAYDVYKGHPHGGFAVHFDTDDLAALTLKADSLKFDSEDLQEKIREQIAKAQKSAKSALKGLHDLHVEFDGSDLNWPDILKSHNQWRDQFDAGQNAFAFQVGPPRHTFEVRDDGSIEVRIRKGDSELLRTFKSADDLAERNPRLHKKYQQLMEADEDE